MTKLEQSEAEKILRFLFKQQNACGNFAGAVLASWMMWTMSFDDFYKSGKK